MSRSASARNTIRPMCMWRRKTWTSLSQAFWQPSAARAPSRLSLLSRRPEQHDVAASADPSRNGFAVRVQDTGSLSLRRGTDGLSCHGPRGCNQGRQGGGSGRSGSSLSGSDRAGRRDRVAGRCQHATLLACDEAVLCGVREVPENRIYVPAERAADFTRSFLRFSHGKVVSDEARRGHRDRPGGGHLPADRMNPCSAR